MLTILLFYFSENLNQFIVKNELFNISKVKYLKGLDYAYSFMFLLFNFAFALSIIKNKIDYEEFLLTKNEELKKSKKSKEDFFAHISHEIRTPINIILGVSKMIINEKHNLESNKKIEYFEVLKESSNSLMNILNDLLELTKFEKYSISIQENPLDLSSSLYLLESFFKYKIQLKKLNFECSFDDKISKFLLGDQNRINQILMNFTSNSIKYSFKGTINVNIKLVEDKFESQIICFEVIDEGIGISEDFIKIIFEPFTQEHSNMLNAEGSGLGMNICKTLIEKMNGNISIESKVDVGTKISFYIEFKKSGNFIKENNNEESTVKGVSTFKKKSILIVDDHDFNRLILNNNLTKSSYTIFEATNGSDAILILEKHKIDLIFMDIGMPVMDGIECSNKIRNELKLSIPIIAFTANVIVKSNEDFIDNGMNDILLKPYKDEDLKLILDKYLGESSSEKLGADKSSFTIGTKKLYSFDNFIENGKYNIELIQKLVKIFISSASTELELIENAFKDNNIKDLNFYSHKLKSSVLYFKIEKSGAALKRFYTIQEINENDIKLFEEVKTELKKVITQFKTIDYNTLKFN